MTGFVQSVVEKQKLSVHIFLPAEVESVAGTIKSICTLNCHGKLKGLTQLSPKVTISLGKVLNLKVFSQYLLL